jgi:hypothetical protein
MIKVKQGHYRDVFGRTVYDVYRDRLIGGTHILEGWRWRVYGPHNTPGAEPRAILSPEFHETKAAADRAARREIARLRETVQC